MATVKKAAAARKRKLNGPGKKTTAACPTQLDPPYDAESEVKKKSKYFPDTSATKAGNSSSEGGVTADKGKTLDKPGASSVARASNSSSRLGFSFYDVPCSDLAQNLLGKKLVMMVGGQRFAGMIVETEAYLGGEDKAAHSYNGKRTDRIEAMYMPPGTAYVYNIYGMYCCINISARGVGAAVLLRSVQPTENLESMARRRLSKGATDTSKLLKNDGRDLCNGPSKICQAFAIKKDAINKVDMCTSAEIWLEGGETISDDKVVKCPRININYAGDWIDKPLRFYILGNKFNSVFDKKAEAEMSK